MTELREPVEQHLEPTATEATTSAMWSVIQRRRTSHTRRWWGAAAISTAIVIAFVTWPRAPNESTPELRALDLSPSMFTPDVHTDDNGTQIVVMPGARLVPLEQTDVRIGWRLERGEASFDVRRSATREFYVDAGAVSVVVVGTRFRVRRDGDRVRVDVDRGAVRVEHGAVLTPVAAGHSFDSSPTVATAPKPETPPIPEAEAARPRTPSPPPLNKAPDSTPPAPAPLDIPNIDPLADADHARADGRTEDASRILSTFLATTPDDPRRGLATFMLARIDQEDYGNASTAAKMFERAVAEGLPGPLEARALARVVECYVSANDRRSARVAARRYLARHPNGDKAEEIRRWAAPP